MGFSATKSSPSLRAKLPTLARPTLARPGPALMQVFPLVLGSLALGCARRLQQGASAAAQPALPMLHFPGHEGVKLLRWKMN